MLKTLSIVLHIKEGVDKRDIKKCDKKAGVDDYWFYEKVSMILTADNGGHD